jgi:uncharacterized protein YndB with AHSA1/START domain
MATKSGAASNAGVVTSQALPSNVVSMHRRRKSGRRGPIRKKIVRWFGPSETRDDSVRAELDVRTGGHFRASFNTADGEYHQVGGVYREVVPNERLVFSWAWHSTPERESLVTVTLKPDGTGTLLTLHHEQFFDQAAADGHRNGWTGSLSKLESYFA